MRRNVFIPGLDDFQRGELATITNARSLAFHGLLEPAQIHHPERHGFEELLARARAELAAFDGSIDAIIAHWDFPTSMLVPVLAAEHGLPAAPLESAVACEHKLWSRREQAASVPEVVPAFAGFDPFDADPLAQIDLDYPFWIKPVKSHSSQLGFRIERAEDLHAALPTIREHITDAGDEFNEVLARVALPPGISATSGHSCIAEQIVTGRQATVEGTMLAGDFHVHGVFDSPRDEHGRHFARYEYPAGLPRGVQQRMAAVAEAFLRHIGYDDACWNIEFMWDPDADRLWLIEVNTRISQSHSDLFTKVDGMSNHEVAVDVALGARPWMPERRGNFAVAAKCFLWTEEVDDGVVTRVPSAAEIARVAERFPETCVQIDVEAGDRLSELPQQSSYRYDLGTLFVGARDRDELVERHRACLAMLPFEIEPLRRTAPLPG